MNILAVDTSNETLQVALQTDTAYESRVVSAGLKHSENLLPLIIEICTEHGLELKNIDLLVCTKGPGSFTGLRIGMATCKGIALASGKPMVSVSTLAAYAWPVRWFDGVVMPVIDAKKRRWYVAAFQDGTRSCSDMDCAPEEAVTAITGNSRILVTGPDAIAFAPLLQGLTEARVTVDTMTHREIGEAMIQLGLKQLQEVGPDDIGEGPVYIRKSDAEIAREARLRAEQAK